MRRTQVLKQTAFAGLLVLVLIVFGSLSPATAQVVDCTNGSPGPDMTIQIFNNSTENIYPVLFAGAPSDTDQWMQACFRIPERDISNLRYPRDSQYRIYVNCCAAGENGIPPSSSVTITLPFYSPLVATINPTEPHQFVDWWQGGGINVYSGASPPTILQSHWAEDNNQSREVTPNSNPPTCAGCSLHFFVAPASIANWEPQQLIEYTLGAAPVAPPELRTHPDTDPFYLWVPDNVDYDVSNVNYAYSPAAIEPYGNSLIGTCCAIGWVGSIASIDAINTALDNWRASSLGTDWPSYVDQSSTTNPKATVPRKVPSALEIFLNFNSFNDTSTYSPAPAASPPIIRMKTLWEDCIQNHKTYAICQRIEDVNALFQANYDHYVEVFNNDRPTWDDVWGCTAPPVELTEQRRLAHLYGWGPFNADSGCNANVNLLEQTPGYTDPQTQDYYPVVKAEYDQLQYWYNVLGGNYGQWTDPAEADYGQFDPYVALIHGRDYMDALYTYAYSVDDAVGNMQTDGTGLIIAIGGSLNLPNENHVTPEVKFTFGYQAKYGNDVITFDQYGRCIASPDTPTVSYFTTFVVPEGNNGEPNSVTNCKITLSDSNGRSFTFDLKQPPSSFPQKPVPTPRDWPSAEEIARWNPLFIDCTGNTNQDVKISWCENIFVYQDKDLTNPHLPTNYFVIMPAPPPCDRSGCVRRS